MTGNLVLEPRALGASRWKQALGNRQVKVWQRASDVAILVKALTLFPVSYVYRELRTEIG